VSNGSALSFVIALRMTFGAFLEAARGVAPEAWGRQPADGGWAPREVVRHVVASELAFAGWVAEAIAIDADLPSVDALPLRTLPEGVASARDALQRCGAIFTRVTNADLPRPCPGYAALQQRSTEQQGEPPGGWGPPTVAGALALALSHADEHTRQLRLLAGH
jgi:hypothetical protein